VNRSESLLREVFETASNEIRVPKARENGIFSYNADEDALEVSDILGNPISAFSKVASPPLIWGRSAAFTRRWQVGTDHFTVPTFGLIIGSNIKLTYVNEIFKSDAMLFPLGRFGLVKDGQAAIMLDLYESRVLWRQAIQGDWKPWRTGDLLVLSSQNETRLFDVFSGMQVWQQEASENNLVAK